MKIKSSRKLQLNKETLRHLTDSELAAAVGQGTTYFCTYQQGCYSDVCPPKPPV